jgi:hypothetical protein
VQPHANPDRTGGKRLPSLDTRVQRVRSFGESNEKRVPLGIHLDTGVRGESPLQSASMFRQNTAYRFPSSISSRVEPSTSVNRNVTVPVGNSATPK